MAAPEELGDDPLAEEPVGPGDEHLQSWNSPAVRSATRAVDRDDLIEALLAA